MTALDKTFDPAAIESRWQLHWEANGLFRPARPDAAPFTIVIPPPNVTGTLHIGHALDNTLQDILIRVARLKGRDARWIVGTDHAGIATQMVVERQLAESTRGATRAELGREKFLEHVWEWKATSGGAIIRQLRRLGASADFANERFTMDPGFSAAVTRVFVELHRQGLLYRDKRLVNWDPKLKTAISDLEVDHREVDGKMWHFRYPLADGPGFIAIATTRPETILGDGAVAVNPSDERYTHLVGQRCRLPIVDRLIPIIADPHVEADFGSGAVKITAAHDFNDFAVYQRHPDAGIPLINLMNPDATMSDACPPAYRGLDRYAAREQVIAEFEALGLLDKIEPHRHQVPFGDRSGVPIEPYLTDQWYVDAKTLAGPAIAAVRDGRTHFVPQTWEKTFFQWMENIQPWCVSRQLWWGHRIPAWYASDGRIFVAEDEAAARAEAGVGVALRQDDDVLDTWFSSALWPFGTLGWPSETQTGVIPANAGTHHPNPQDDGQRATEATNRDAQEMGSRFRGNDKEGADELQRHYPSDVLVTGFDIIFFWVARMMMQGLHVMDEVPFRTVYCHGLVRDRHGQKMSKSKGNTIDPLTLVDRYGADALRFTLAAMETQGRDIKLDEKRIEGYRNFATKLWNAARFAQANGVTASASIDPPPAVHAVNRWIVGEVAKTRLAMDAALAAFRFDELADAIYRLVWSRFCDWYVELAKPLLADDATAAETRAVAGWALDQMLVLLHPLMPFITEELWAAMGERPYELIVAKWPTVAADAIDVAAVADVDWLIDLISEVRATRNELGVSPGTRLPLHVRDAAHATSARLAAHAPAIERLARIERIDPAPAPAGGAAQLVLGEATYVLPLEGVIDLAAERARLAKGSAAAQAEAAKTAARLSSPAFVEKAKPEVVEENRARLTALTAEAERLRAALARLG